MFPHPDTIYRICAQRNRDLLAEAARHRQAALAVAKPVQPGPNRLWPRWRTLLVTLARVPRLILGLLPGRPLPSMEPPPDRA